MLVRAIMRIIVQLIHALIRKADQNKKAAIAAQQQSTAVTVNQQPMKRGYDYNALRS